MPAHSLIKKLRFLLQWFTQSQFPKEHERKATQNMNFGCLSSYLKTGSTYSLIKSIRSFALGLKSDVIATTIF